MVRRWFSIAGVLAFVGVMLAADASQAGPLQRLRDRLRGRSDEGTTLSSRFGFRRSFFRNAEPAQMAVASNQVALDIRVPANAEVWVNDKKMSQTGTLRTYTDDSLTTGQTYSYKIKAEWTPRGGSKESHQRSVEARPGERKSVDFNRSRTSPEQIKQPKESNGSKEKD